AVIAPVNAEGKFVKVITFTGNKIINFQRHQSTRHHFRIGIAQRERQALAVRNGVTEGNVTAGNIGLIIADGIQLGKVGFAVKQIKAAADAIDGVIRVEEREIIRLGVIVFLYPQRHTVTGTKKVILADAGTQNHATAGGVTNVEIQAATQLFFHVVIHINQVIGTGYGRRIDVDG